MVESQDDPRYKVKDIIDAVALTIDDDTTPATELFMYSDGEEDFETLFDTYDVLFLIGPPSRYVASRREQQIPHYEDYFILVTVVTINKTGVTGTTMQWKAEVGLRLYIENAGLFAGGSIQINPEVRPANVRVGGTTIYKRIYTIRYRVMT